MRNVWNKKRKSSRTAHHHRPPSLPPALAFPISNHLPPSADANLPWIAAPTASTPPPSRRRAEPSRRRAAAGGWAAIFELVLEVFFFLLFSFRFPRANSEPSSLSLSTPALELERTKKTKKTEAFPSLPHSPGLERLFCLREDRALDRLLLPPRGQKKQQKQEQHRERAKKARPFFHRESIPSIAPPFRFPLPRKKKRHGLHGPLLHVPPRRRADRAHLPGRGGVSFCLFVCFESGERKKETREKGIDRWGKKRRGTRKRKEKKLNLLCFRLFP